MEPSTSGYSYEEISEPYYFETDHVALKDNQDYHQMLHSIAILEAQRLQAAKDIDALYKAQTVALADPLAFVERLQKGEDLSFPKPQRIAPLPDINWENYSSNMNFSSFGASQHMLRKKKNQQENNGATSSLQTKLQLGLPPSSAEAGSDLVVVRGRAKDKSKPATFNQLWTEEEQQRLEQLLITYPPEEVEAKRWTKIAEALGNRTAIQVCSRVQKYFLRLAKEGLPIPGRMPNVSNYSKKGSHRHHRYNRLYYQNSTLLQSHIPPVWMKDEDEDRGASFVARSVSAQRPAPSTGGENTPAASETTSTKDESSDDDDDIPIELINTPEYQELQKLQRLKKQLLAKEQASAVRHIGYKCDKCEVEPIIGTRWHCIDCPADMSFDFCENCCESYFQKDKHDLSHRLQPFKHAMLDSDYMNHNTQDYNYLDPNYMPAS